MNADLPAKILLVDDLQENLVALGALLRGDDRQLFTARSGDEALALMLEHDFALALLDVQMPSMNGFELAELMRGTERTRRIPIVFVSAAGRELNYAFRGYESGAVDFLHKPLDPHVVRSKVSVFIDLFRQRQALQVAQAELERAVRMRDDFMSLVSHELRNPLNTLYLQLQLRKRMQDGGPQIDPSALRSLTERDERQIQGMIRLLDDLLDVSRIRTGRLAVRPAPMDLGAMVHRVVEAIGEQAKAKGVTFTLQAPQSLPWSGDEYRLEQVVNNLLTNGLRYGDGKPVAVSLTDEGDHACIAVRDQGPGIAPEDQGRIFEQFERGDSPAQVQGLGLGLYVCRQIVEGHGGRIELQSRPGEGAAFFVRLPRPSGEA
jgi:signal transduction histidine kinase